MTGTQWVPTAPELVRQDSVPCEIVPYRPECCLTEKIRLFLQHQPATPFLALDLAVVGAKYRELRQHFPNAAIHYTVKANPAKQVVSLLAAHGSNFHVGSLAELDLCLSLGVAPERLSYGNTIKKAADIDYAFHLGVRRFAFDSEGELRKLGVHAPGSLVTCRLQTTGKHSASPLAKKFGCDRDMACHLLVMSRYFGLKPIGVGFHVGSQQTDPAQWEQPMQEAAVIFRKVARHGIELDTVNAGGGFPVPYEGTVPAVPVFAHAISQSMGRAFGSSQPSLILEPGRCLAAEAGVIQSEVVLVARKSLSDATRWVYLDVGKFTGLAETLDESIKYRFRTARTGILGPVVLAGPTSSSADILYEKTPYELPLDLECGDSVTILNAGAYTSSYASVAFNGFPTLRTYCL